MRTVLLGPQRFMTTAGTALRSLGVEGPVATINAGWEDREDVVDELDQVIGGETRHLRLHHRMFDVIEKDAEFASAAMTFRDRHDALLSLYRLRLQHALDGVYAVQLKTLYAELDASSPIDASGVIGWHRGELAALLGGSAALVLTGGHV